MKRSDCLVAQALLTAARQRPEHGAEHCRLVLEHLDTGTDALLRPLAGTALFIDNPTLFSKPEDRR